MKRPFNQCRRCEGMIGVLSDPADLARGAHKLCEGLTDTDWLALRPWFSGNLLSVQMGGE